VTAFILGRPRRRRPADRVNYKIDSDIRAMLSDIAERKGRNEGAQVEQLVLFYAATERLNSKGEKLTLDSIDATVREIWSEISASDKLNQGG